MELRGVYGRHARPHPRIQPLALFAANLLWPIGPEGGHKTHKGCWAWTGLPVASIDAS
jgi:hypothetical protein